MTGYTYIGIMYKLKIEQGAQDDIRSMRAGDENTARFAASILVILQEIKNDQNLLGSLLDHGFENEKFNVSKFQEFWRANNRQGGLDLWRLKAFEVKQSSNEKRTIPYRIIYAYSRNDLEFYVLAIVHRDFEYAPEHPIVKRVLSDYRKLGLSEYQFTSIPSGKYRH